mgnify:CR=1 FL=1
MVSYSVQHHQKARALQALHTTLWHGKTEKCSQSQRTMDWSTSMIWTALSRDPNSTLRAQELRTSKFFRHQLDMPFWYGLRTSMIRLARATTENTRFSMLEFTKARIATSFLFLTIRFKTFSGHTWDQSSSWSQDSNQPPQLCITQTGSQYSSLERDLETPSESVLSAILWCSEDSETSRKEKWTSGVSISKKKLQWQELKLHVPPGSLGRLVDATFSHVCSTKDWR